MSDQHVSSDGLVALIDRLLDTGAVVAGQVTIRLADIDLVDLDARLLLTGTEAAVGGSRPGSVPVSSGAPTPVQPLRPVPVLPERLDADRRGEDGIARLVLVLVELLRQVLTSQAVARMEGGSLDTAQIERLGRALLLLEQRCDALRDFLTRDPAWLPFPAIDRSARP
jgi:hypothetical protein